jgi:hypothetical protein
MAVPKKKTERITVGPGAPPPGGVVSGTVVEVEESIKTEQAFYPDLQPNSKFVLAYHPGRFVVMEGRVVPSLARVSLRAGVQGVQEVGQGEGKAPLLSYEDTLQQWRKGGWTIIRHTDAPNGRSYLASVPVRGGVHYLTVFETAHIGSDRTTCNVAEYADWLDSLFLKGELASPYIQGIERMREQTRKRLDSASKQAQHSPGARALVERLTADVAALDAYLEKVSGGGAPVAPTPVDPD